MSNFTVLQDTQFDALIDAIKNGGGGGGGSYTLPPATATSLGGIKVGSGLSITSDGKLSATGGGGGGGSENYSQNEQEIGTWLDGKTLYQKSYVLNSLSASTSDWTRLLEVVGADNIISIEGFAVGSSNQLKMLINTAYISSRISNNVINYYVEGLSTWGSLDFTVTVKYTKS